MELVVYGDRHGEGCRKKRHRGLEEASKHLSTLRCNYALLKSVIIEVYALRGLRMAWYGCDLCHSPGIAVYMRQPSAVAYTSTMSLCIRLERNRAICNRSSILRLIDTALS